MNITSLIFYISGSAWLASEIRLNLRDRGIIDTAIDQRSGVGLLVLITGAITACIFILYAGLWKIPLSPGILFLLGTVFICAGAALRVLAVRCLGKYFRTRVSMEDGQALVRWGPYRFIRHPAYAGAMLVFLGTGVGFGSWLSLGVMLVLPFVGYLRRIRLEECAMINRFPEEYPRFINATRKLIPYIY
jgi:protein-S-isoprenylcysteine O-methyltransferase Ste14